MFNMKTDELWPRIPDYRYRIYAVTDGVRRVLGAAPDMAGVGLAIGTWHEEALEQGRRLADEGRIGILDTMPGGEPHPAGDWVVLPWDRHGD